MSKHHDGYRAIAQAFYNSWKWKKCRKSFIISRLGLCESCGKGGTHVHHIIELDATNIHDPNYTLNHDNLQLLCATCHQRLHELSPATVKGMMFDDEGNLINNFNPPHIE